jgi:hypothetical protein
MNNISEIEQLLQILEDNLDWHFQYTDSHPRISVAREDSLCLCDMVFAIINLIEKINTYGNRNHKNS